MKRLFALLVIALLAVCFALCRTEAAPTLPVRVVLPAARDANAPGGLPLRKLMDIPMRDPNITLGPDGNYYLVGTTNPAAGYTQIAHSDLTGQMWTVNDGIRLWKSPDMVHWQSLGLIWSIDRDAAGTWVHWWPAGTPNPGRAIWAPEIHYLKGTYWIPYCTRLQEPDKPLACGLLRSTTGRPEGPYKDVQPDTPLGGDDDASLFEDTDGAVYYLFGGYKIAHMKPDMSGLAEAPRDITFAQPPTWGEGIFLTKVKGKYIFVNTGTPSLDPRGEDTHLTTYDCFSAVSTGSIYGPYTARYRAIPHDGHNNLFQDKKGRWWSTYFGSDSSAPFAIGASGRPCVLPVTIEADGHLRFARTLPRPQWRYQTSRPSGDWKAAAYPDAAWKTGGGAFGDPAVSQHGQVTDVGTDWTQGDLWLRKTFSVTTLPKSPNLYLRHNGPVQVFLNGREIASSPAATADYEILAFSDPGALRRGRNTLAVHCVKEAEAPAYIDLGIVDVPPPPVAVPVVSTSESAGQTWRYTTEPPVKAWQGRTFDDRAWQSGPALFGNAVLGVRTAWTSSDLWMRRTFILKRSLKNPRLRVFHDEDVQVFIDGALAASETGYLAQYQNFLILSEARAALTPGTHTLAVHCHQSLGGQGVDVGLVNLPPL